MLPKHKLNLEESKALYQKWKHLIKKGYCYHNVFYVYDKNRMTFKNRGWKIAYGYYPLIENLMARHCFIIDENNEVIDPTLIALSSFEETKEYDYYSFVQYNTNEYLDMLTKHDGDVSLDKAFRNKRMEYYEMAQEKGLIFVN